MNFPGYSALKYKWEVSAHYSFLVNPLKSIALELLIIQSLACE